MNSNNSHAPNQWVEEPPRPPASRRAASTGAIGVHAGPSRANTENLSTSPGAWQPGMPLPPPPPGPPPNARSHSMTRPQLDTTPSLPNSIRAPPTRRPPGQGTALGPVPPTPADWVEESGFPEPPGQPSRSGDLVTTSPGANSRQGDLSDSHEFESPHNPSRNSLVRMPARRDPSAKGIRERRSESRADQRRRSYIAGDTDISNGVDDIEPVKPADLVLPTTNSSTLVRRRTIARSTPRTPKALSSPYDGLDSARSRAESEPFESMESAHSTPRPGSSHPPIVRETFAPTPPFSPGHDRFTDPVKSMRPSPPLPPKSLPTPPPQHPAAVSGLMSPSFKSDGHRPVSHILHSPLTDPAMPSPLMPQLTTTVSSALQGARSETPESFKKAAMERHRLFAEKEASANSDRERIELFAEFIIAESSLRKNKYAEAIQSMGTKIQEMTRDLFKSSPQSSVAYTSFGPKEEKQLSVADLRANGHNGSLTAAVKGFSSADASPEDYQPPVRANLKLNTQDRPDSTWWNGYMPSLSPIASMGGTSGTPDEMSSRGRPASRWWEASQEGSANGDGTRRCQRSKRESKYMGLPREVRESLQWDVEPSPSGALGSSASTGPNGRFSYSQDEYPPEKSGWHEPTLDDGYPPPPPLLPQSSSPFSASTVSRPDSKKVDVSRLVTLPPPYPRHHPAVNNNHPDLAAIRSVIRSLSDLEDVKATKERYALRIDGIREQARQEAGNRRSQLVADIQRQIQAGSMTYAEAARHEAELEAIESARKKDRAQLEFDTFQSEVVHPLESFFSERIDRATASISELQGILFIDAQELSPNMTQEEGDEQPELLEKLTQLKWLFEAREQLHREQQELSRERTEKYKLIVTTPYILQKNTAKLREAEAFFTRDAIDRKYAFDQGSLARFEDFLHIVESNVVRGVEQQLSAFWDIAPSLSAVIEQIPEDNNRLHTLDILIPPAELDENPSYRTFPLLYLHSLLDHAHRSTYQFIESQTNLLCLLHEVKTAVMVSQARLTETCRVREGDDPMLAAAEATRDRDREEARITDDLKEKVRVVEALWDEGLGKELSALRERVKEWLVEVGGWEDADD
ncbi:hypothetical protein L228DRAFT_243644 [Xylona heveae TC161]|uniref:Uncharacterized protein n=1 Tax=Xylona heveae (strain CBS 132557 / TC161) TaxID=1328760 RepID=A0A165IHB6_XYLHT|nr:hypothetical protein L228DRAFT_243644 [Xylona heveae TC161]KZF24898.1 hypothetical protein L228DRAFT_243644 [Xylona heveae TC161]